MSHLVDEGPKEREASHSTVQRREIHDLETTRGCRPAGHRPEAVGTRSLFEVKTIGLSSIRAAITFSNESKQARKFLMILKQLLYFHFTVFLSFERLAQVARSPCRAHSFSASFGLQSAL